MTLKARFGASAGVLQPAQRPRLLYTMPTSRLAQQALLCRCLLSAAAIAAATLATSKCAPSGPLPLLPLPLRALPCG